LFLPLVVLGRRSPLAQYRMIWALGKASNSRFARHEKGSNKFSAFSFL